MQARIQESSSGGSNFPKNFDKQKNKKKKKEKGRGEEGGERKRRVAVVLPLLQKYMYGLNRLSRQLFTYKSIFG